MLKNLYNSINTVSNLQGSSIGYWIPNSDAMFITLTTESMQSVRVYRDGTEVHISRVSNTESLKYDQAPEYNGLIIHRTSGLAYQLHPMTWTINLQKPFVTGVAFSVTGNGVYLRNRDGVMKYYARFARGYRIYDVSTGVLESTVEVFASGVNIENPIQWVKDQILAFFRDSGEVALWDVDAGELVLSSFIDAPSIAVVDQQYQNIVSVRNSDKIVQVWDLQVEPDHFSALSADPGNYLRYNKEELSITVLGDQDEPVANTEVIWSLKAYIPTGAAVNEQAVNEGNVGGGSTVSAPLGKLSPTISLTDENGVARVMYCPPGNDWVSGMQEIITARVFL